MSQEIRSFIYHPRHLADVAPLGASVYTESFDSFRTFVHSENLDATVAEAFEALLENLFEQTGHVWKPSYCKFAPTVTKHVRELADKYLPQGTRSNVMLSEQLSHLWTRIALPNQPLLVVDPAGVFDLKIGRILPYFGPITDCTVAGIQLEDAAKVYNGSAELSTDLEKAWRTIRSLPAR